MQTELRAVAAAALAVALLSAPAADGADSVGQTAPGATNVTYTPTGGEPNPEAKQIKLVKQGTHGG